MCYFHAPVVQPKVVGLAEGGEIRRRGGGNAAANPRKCESPPILDERELVKNQVGSGVSATWQHGRPFGFENPVFVDGKDGVESFDP